MKYQDDDCIKALVSEYDTLDSFVFIGWEDKPGCYFTCSIRSNVLFNHIIEKDDLAIAFKEYLLKISAPIYKNMEEFKQKNPNVIC